MTRMLRQLSLVIITSSVVFVVMLVVNVFILFSDIPDPYWYWAFNGPRELLTIAGISVVGFRYVFLCFSIGMAAARRGDGVDGGDDSDDDV